ncbi:hypothetical protein J6590_100554 [Homalodisca vitripennis]|nr:hypothetical protein J6590_100554 [Homalodisca vitripennis]
MGENFRDRSNDLRELAGRDLVTLKEQKTDNINYDREAKISSDRPQQTKTWRTYCSK